MDPTNTDIKPAVEQKIKDMDEASQGSSPISVIFKDNKLEIGVTMLKEKYQKNPQSIIKELHDVIQKTIVGLWCVGDDFNSILFENEHRSRVREISLVDREGRGVKVS